MLDELVTLPVRVGVRVTRLWFRALEETFSVTSSATGRVIGLLASRSQNGAGRRVPSSERALREERPLPPTPEPTQVSHKPKATPEPTHVSEEPELVEAFAEPGAAQGAGPEIHVDTPWDGYEQMSAKEVISRFATADRAELATVQLYEGSHRRRQTVMKAVERELRIANGERLAQKREINPTRGDETDA